jgi:NADH-quinone oxidoreductase subunit A
LDLSQYFSVIVFFALAIGLAVAPLVLNYILAPRQPNDQKNSPYECGFEPFSDARMPFDVRFYLVAILFIMFDLETAFLFPWGVSLKAIGAPGFWAMVLFLSILVVGFVFEWKKGALEWE